ACSPRCDIQLRRGPYAAHGSRHHPPTKGRGPPTGGSVGGVGHWCNPAKLHVPKYGDGVSQSLVGTAVPGKVCDGAGWRWGGVGHQAGTRGDRGGESTRPRGPLTGAVRAGVAAAHHAAVV